MKSLSRFFRKRHETPPAVDVGIANVDPEPMTQIAGEGIDPDANDKAHSSVKEQRERLPGERER